MPKIKIHINLITDEEKKDYTIPAIYQNQRLIYQEDDDKKTKVIYDYKSNNLIRENEELYMNYSFNKNKITKGIIKVKELNKSLEVDIKTTKLIKKEQNLSIDFIIEGQKFNYKIEVI